MPKFEFCIPTTGKIVPAGADWFHEIKYDGYRLRIERNDKTVRLVTRGGHDWAARFPWIKEAALRNRSRQFVIDGEAVVLGVNGISDFNALHSGKQNAEVQLCAFDVLAIDGEDVPPLVSANTSFFCRSPCVRYPEFFDPFDERADFAAGMVASEMVPPW